LLDTNHINLWPNWLSEYWESFIDFLWEFTSLQAKELEEVIEVCRKIEWDPYKDRKTWHRYIVHLYESTELYVSLFWPDIYSKKIISSLLHDGIEDINDDTVDSIEESNGRDSAFYVHILSKSNLLEGNNRVLEYNTRFQSQKSLAQYIREEYYFLYKETIWRKKSEKIAKMILMIKACDRINNLTTMPLEYFKVKKVRAKIEETREYLIPIVLEIFGEASKVYQEMLRAIFFAEQRIISSYVKKKLI